MHSLYINLQIVHTCLYFLITSFAEPFDPSPDFKALVISSLYASYLAFHFVKDASGTWILKQGSFLISTYDVKKNYFTSDKFGTPYFVVNIDEEIMQGNKLPIMMRITAT